MGWPKHLPKLLQNEMHKAHFRKRAVIHIQHQCFFMRRRFIVPPSFRYEVSDSIHQQHNWPDERNPKKLLLVAEYRTRNEGLSQTMRTLSRNSQTNTKDSFYIIENTRTSIWNSTCWIFDFSGHKCFSLIDR